MNFTMLRISNILLISFIVMLIHCFNIESTYCQSLIYVETYGTNLEIGNRIKRNIQRMIDIINSPYSNRTQLNRLRNICTENGIRAFSNLIRRNHIRFEQNEYHTELIALENTGFQVRDLEVKLNVKNNNVSTKEYLIFDFDKRGKINDVRYSLWNKYCLYRISPLVSNKETKLIGKFLEDYQTAFINKNIERIDSLFKEETIIIVGNVKIDTIHDESGSQEVATLYSRTKEKYLKRLKEIVFKQNKYVIPIFELIEIARHEIYPEIFGISLLQHWHSSIYNDCGWLFLLFNLSDKTNPIIQLRRWSPKLKDSDEHFGFKNIIFTFPDKVEKPVSDLFK